MVHSRPVAATAVVHSGHAGIAAGAMVHAAHAHIGHGQKRRIAQRRYGGARAGCARKGGNTHAGAVHRLRHKRVSLLPARRHDDVIGLGHADLELVDLYRFDVLPVRLNDGHRQARNADIEEGHGAGIDEAQPHTFTRTEEIFQIVERPVAIE